MNLESKLRLSIKHKDETLLDIVFEEIYYEYSNLSAFIISKYVQNKLDVEELVNDVFFNFYNTIFKTEINNIKYYIVSMSKNTAINYMMKKKIYFEYDETYINNYKELNDETLYYDIISDMKKVLSETEINIILLHKIYMYSINDIANKYNQPRTTISSIYKRAIKKFQKGIKL